MSQTPYYRTRRFLATQYEDEDTPDFDPTLFRYLVAQKETCSTTGRVHWQCYIEMEKPHTITGMCKKFPHTTFLVAEGNKEQNFKYCTKLCHEHWRDMTLCTCPPYGPGSRVLGTDYIELGTSVRMGQRTDLAPFVAAVKSGKRRHELIEEYAEMFMKYPRFYDLLKLMQPHTRNLEKKVIVLIGPTGLGKTRMVWDRHEGTEDFYDKPLGELKWFDGYDSHKHALFDEFTGQVKLDQLLPLLDVYPKKVEIKGGVTWWHPETVYITSNFKPHEWYDFSFRMRHYPALIRRIKILN